MSVQRSRRRRGRPLIRRCHVIPTPEEERRILAAEEVANQRTLKRIRHKLHAVPYGRHLDRSHNWVNHGYGLPKDAYVVDRVDVPCETAREMVLIASESESCTWLIFGRSVIHFEVMTDVDDLLGLLYAGMKVMAVNDYDHGKQLARMRLTNAPRVKKVILAGAKRSRLKTKTARKAARQAERRELRLRMAPLCHT